MMAQRLWPWRDASRKRKLNEEKRLRVKEGKAL